MFSVRRSAERGQASFGWLDSRHTFSFGHYYDPRFMGFGPLRVINQDVVAPGQGFARHGHANMEILSYVIDGALEHKDSIGTGSVIRPGELQRMSAGSGIEHSEFNASASERVHFLQIWIQPDRLNIAPGYEQRAFAFEQRRNRLALLASGHGEADVIAVRQDMRLYGSLLDAGATLSRELDQQRRYWLQVVRGSLTVNADTRLLAGDGLAISDERELRVLADLDAEFLLFDLP